MTRTNILLDVAQPEASARFYARLLGQEPVEASPTFVLFLLPEGPALSLRARNEIVPAPVAAGGGCEIGLQVDRGALVDATHADWAAKGATIILSRPVSGSAEASWRSIRMGTVRASTLRLRTYER